ncbi:class I SAM-dependent methyltransferase [Larkinella rosea]|uniref:Class I SAM-dependent methyltransferase n=1 Tax=Larkinella rosea TaxID=2025312 RepID=A0A3P1C1D1_9BACT|nr:class I SAM-dependent methyltransferase [Larkinella rosea]RRB07092.1 class I SAM-dependent methyltransferase [Larkinella rosea]
MAKPSASSGFDLIAPIYDPLSRLVFGNALRKAQSHWLDQIPQNAVILIFGGGSGWLLTRVLAICSPHKVIYIDASPVMVSLAREKVANDKRVDFRVGTETAIASDDRVDAVLTPFILDLFTEDHLQNHLIPVLIKTLNHNGLWLCTDFSKPVTDWQRALMWCQYRFFRIFSQISANRLPNWLALMNNLLRSDPQQLASFFGGFIASAYWRKAAD